MDTLIANYLRRAAKLALVIPAAILITGCTGETMIATQAADMATTSPQQAFVTGFKATRYGG